MMADIEGVVSSFRADGPFLGISEYYILSYTVSGQSYSKTAPGKASPGWCR